MNPQAAKVVQFVLHLQATVSSKTCKLNKSFQNKNKEKISLTESSREIPLRIISLQLEVVAEVASEGTIDMMITMTINEDLIKC